METLQEQIARNQEEARQLKRQLNESTPADGLWNPADYISNSNFITGGTFKRQFNKLPEDAQKYIQEQIYKRQQSGYPVTKSFLRVLQWHVRSNPNWDFEGKRNFDISGYLASDKGMARRINRQDNSTITKNQTGGTPQNTVPKPQGTGAQGTGAQGTVPQGTVPQGTNTQGTGTQGTKPSVQNTDTQNELMQQNMNDIEEREREAQQRMDQQKQTEQELMQQNMNDIEEREREAQQNQANKATAVKSQSNQITQDTVNQINDSTDAVGNVSMPKTTSDNSNDPDYNPNWTAELEAKYGKQTLRAKQLKLNTKYDEDTWLNMNNNNQWGKKYLKLKKAMGKAQNSQEKQDYQNQLDLLLNGVY